MAERSATEAEDKESFQIGGKNRWFKPNYHAHIVFDWMNHETGKKHRKLNDEDKWQTGMQTLASDILLDGTWQAEKKSGYSHRSREEHLERNDFIIEKQKANKKELQNV